jgi:beta-lactamase class D
MPAETRFVQQFDYGNIDTRGGLDKTGAPFWMDGTLRISANEQVEFLRKFYESQLGLSDRTTRLTKAIMLEENPSTWTLSGHSGACHPESEDTTNWRVGYVEKSDGVHYFALETGDKFGRFFPGGVSAREILTELGVLR